MLLNNIKPQKCLESVVRFYRIIDFDFSNQADDISPTKAYRPRIEHCLQFTPFDKEIVTYSNKKCHSYQAAIFGQQTQLSQRKLGKRFLNVQIVFQPGVLQALLKISMEELRDVYIDAELFLGKNLQLINEQIVGCKSYEAMLEKVESFLINFFYHKTLKLHPINNIVRLINSQTTSQKIEWFANQANLCYRQFDRAFKANTGITPKDFRTLINLDIAYLIKNRNPDKDWLSIALQSNFYDYQHLSKNFKQFIGYSPTQFYEIEQQAPERFFGDFEQ